MPENKKQSQQKRYKNLNENKEYLKEAERLNNNISPEIEEKLAKQAEQEAEAEKLTPKNIKKYLDRFVIGQDHAKKTLAVAFFNHIQRIIMKDYGYKLNLEKSNIILAGPSGCGKTHLIKTLAGLFKIPYCICDATTLTESGYVGSDVESVLQKLYQAADYDLERTQNGIVFIDEIDKKALKNRENTSITRDVSGEGVQQALLKLIEGNIVDIPICGERKHPQIETIPINTKNILFIMSGSFPGIEKIIKKRLFQKEANSIKINGIKENIPEAILNTNKEAEYNELIKNLNSDDLQAYGLIPEFIGRMPVISYVTQLTRNELLKILTEPQNSIIKQYQTIFEINGKELNFTKDALEVIADHAIKAKTGARNLRTELEGILLEPMYNITDPPKDNEKITITTADVNKYHLSKNNKCA